MVIEYHKKTLIKIYIRFDRARNLNTYKKIKYRVFCIPLMCIKGQSCTKFSMKLFFLIFRLYLVYKRSFLWKNMYKRLYIRQLYIDYQTYVSNAL